MDRVDRETIKKSVDEMDKEPLKAFFVEMEKALSFMINLGGDDNKFWDHFQVTSETEWEKYSKLPKKETLLY